MNPYTAEHPYDSVRDNKNNGLRSHVFAVLLLAFILSPFLTSVLWFLNATDNGNSTGGLVPDPLWIVVIEGIVASSVLALVAVSSYWLFARVFWYLKRIAFPKALSAARRAK